MTSGSSPTTRPPVGVIGLGIMGSAYAANLLAGGFPVHGFDVATEARSRFAATGGRVCDSAGAVAASTERILLALPSPGALNGVVAEIAPRLRPSSIVCEMGTFSLADKERARLLLNSSGAAFLDCPVSGTGSQAAVADIVVFSSGDEAAARDMGPVFAAIARKVRHVGAFGMGMKIKCVANLLVTINNLATAEALVLAQRAGLDLDVTIDAIREGAGNSRIFELRAPLMAEGRYEPASMKLEVHAKDLAIIEEFATGVGAPTPLFAASAPFYAAAIAEGRGKQDTAALYEVLKGQHALHLSEPGRSS
jgi:putative dehydrogenase